MRSLEYEDVHDRLHLTVLASLTSALVVLICVLVCCRRIRRDQQQWSDEVIGRVRAFCGGRPSGHSGQDPETAEEVPRREVSSPYLVPPFSRPAPSEGRGGCPDASYPAEVAMVVSDLEDEMLSGTSAAVYTRLHGRPRAVTPLAPSSTAPATSVTMGVPHPTPVLVTKRTGRVDLDRLSVALNARALAEERRRRRRSGPIPADLAETSFHV